MQTILIIWLPKLNYETSNPAGRFYDLGEHPWWSHPVDWSLSQLGVVPQNQRSILSSQNRHIEFVQNLRVEPHDPSVGPRVHVLSIGLLKQITWKVHLCSKSKKWDFSAFWRSWEKYSTIPDSRWHNRSNRDGFSAQPQCLGMNRSK